MNQPLLILLSVDLITSLILFILYWIDKRKAEKGKSRIAERTLFLFALLGGWPGGFVGSRVFRHKTKKVSFRVLFMLIVLFNSGFQFYLIQNVTKII